jgi:hypothetical protein
MLKIHETTGADGELVPVSLKLQDGALWIMVGAASPTGGGAIGAEPSTGVVPSGAPAPREAYALGVVALEAVMKRFGAPLEPTEPITTVAALDLGDGRAVRHVRHLGRYDVIARDFLVYEARGCEPLCALATTVSGALVHLGRATSAAR